MTPGDMLDSTMPYVAMAAAPSGSTPMPGYPSVNIDGKAVQVRQDPSGMLLGLRDGHWAPLYARLRGTTLLSMPEGDPVAMPTWQAVGAGSPQQRPLTNVDWSNGPQRDVYEFSFNAPDLSGWQWQERNPSAEFFATDENPNPAGSQYGWYKDVNPQREWVPPVPDGQGGESGGFWRGGPSRVYGNPWQGWGLARGVRFDDLK
jgi:hypothetical protein